MVLAEFEWMVVCGGLVAFAMAFGIGANDVANAFATSVGSKALTLKQATVLAAIFEFAGAVGLGASVTRTIAGSIASSSSFKNQPDLFLYGMLCALVAATIWLNLATVLSLPVSTTHSTVGGVLGMALVFGAASGKDAVIWVASIDEFPYFNGVLVIIVSWFTSPLLSGLLAAGFFLTLRTFVLRKANSLRLAVITLPIVIFFVIWASMWFILSKGISGQVVIEDLEAMWIAAVVAVGCGVIGACVMPLILRKVEAEAAEKDAKLESGKEVVAAEEVAEEKPTGIMAWIMHGVNVDVTKVDANDTATQAIHANAEVFNPDAENFYKYAQIFSACCDAFAHGANDVANSIGPFAAMYYVYRNNGKIASRSDAPKWILVIGAAGIVVGLATYGYNIMKVLGQKTIKITPSRGFCIEMATAMIVAIGSALGIPLSTTQCQVGGTWGVGLTEGAGGINWLLALKIFVGWVFTLFLTAGLSGALFAQGIYSPTILADVKAPK